jgi:hypothetical protein
MGQLTISKTEMAHKTAGMTTTAQIVGRNNMKGNLSFSLTTKLTKRYVHNALLIEKEWVLNMSLMGYETDDIEGMINSINLARECVNVRTLMPNQSPIVVKEGLKLAVDFLEGLLEEGRV